MSRRYFKPSIPPCSIITRTKILPAVTTIYTSANNDEALYKVSKISHLAEEMSTIFCDRQIDRLTDRQKVQKWYVSTGWSGVGIVMKMNEGEIKTMIWDIWTRQTDRRTDRQTDNKKEIIYYPTPTLIKNTTEGFISAWYWDVFIEIGH
jgi:hypothetical protein